MENLNRQHIVVVEDEANLLTSIKTALIKNKYQVTPFSDSNEALNRVTEMAESGSPPSLLVTDLVMPKLNGMDLIAALADKKVNIPVLVMTAFGDKQKVVQLMQHGVRDYLEKPFTPDVLLERIDLLFEQLQNESDEKVQHIKKTESEKIMLEEQLFQSQKMEALGVLAGGIAHDFNNILNHIMGYAQLIQLDPEKPTEVLDHSSKIMAAGERAKALITQILTFSRKSPTEFKPIKLEEIIQNSLDLVRISTPPSLTITTEFPSDLEPVIGNWTQIHQVVMNLITNSIQAMEEKKGGKLHISIGKTYENSTHTYQVLRIQDTGCGIPQDQLQHIFEPYFTTKPEGKGTGLGLSVVHGIIKNHQGKIDVTSKPGEGTTFHIYIPITLTQESQPAIPEENPYQGNGETILFVDDEAVLTDIGKGLLGHLNYKVIPRTSSVEALRFYEKKYEEIDLVITDMRMPNLNGLQLSQKLKAITPEVPIIICTGFSDLNDPQEVMAAGIHSIIKKPYMKEEMAKEIKQALKIKKTQ